MNISNGGKLLKPILEKIPEPGQYEMYRFELRTKSFFGLFPRTVTERVHVGLVKRHFKALDLSVKYTLLSTNANRGKLSIVDFLWTVDEFIPVNK